MKDRLLILLLFGIGVIKVCKFVFLLSIHAYLDNEHDDDISDSDLIDVVKHKHSRRDVDGVQANLENAVQEDLVEVIQGGLHPKIYGKCHTIEDECSCW